MRPATSVTLGLVVAACLAPLGAFAGVCPDSCVDSNGNAQDKGKSDCLWYKTNQEACGTSDDSDFTAAEMCCACGGCDQCACPNGEPDESATCEEGVEACASCNVGWTLDIDQCKENVCACSAGAPTTGAECPTAGAEACASCNVGWTLDIDQCKENVCECSAGTPATGAKCPTAGAEVCVTCTEFGFELNMSEGNETGTCVPIVQELCNCPNGVAAEGIECTVREDLVVGSPTADSWEVVAGGEECEGSGLERNAPHEGAITLKKGACPAGEGDVFQVHTDVPDGAKQVTVSFKFLEECVTDCVPLSVALFDNESMGEMFAWCVKPGSADLCDYSFPEEEHEGSNHTLMFSFHKYFEKYGQWPARPRLLLATSAKGQNQTVEVLKVDFEKEHFFKNEEDDVCTECSEGFTFINHEGSATGFCQVANESGEAGGAGLRPGAAQGVAPGSVESMPASAAAAGAASAAAGAIGRSALPEHTTSRIGSFAVAFVASFFAVGLFLGARVWKSHQYANVEAHLLTQEVPEDTDGTA